MSKCCKRCTQTCRYPIDQLLTGNGMNQQDINKELKEHGHPSSRKIEGRYRITNEARQELIDHYKYAHAVVVPSTQVQAASTQPNHISTSERLAASVTKKQQQQQPALGPPPPPALAAEQSIYIAGKINVTQAVPITFPTAVSVSNGFRTTEPRIIPQNQSQQPQQPNSVEFDQAASFSKLLSSRVITAQQPPPHSPQTISSYHDYIGIESHSTMQLIEHYKYSYGLILDQD